MNIVPKSGGNTLRGSFFASGTAGKFQSDNLTAELIAQGVTAATPLTKVYDLSGTVGGPIVTDRLWYFVNGHTGGSTKESANVYYNLNAGDPNRWLYAPDVSRREYSDRTFENASGRLTWQVTPRHKVSGFWDVQSAVSNLHRCHGRLAGAGASVAGSGRRPRPAARCHAGHVVVATHESTVGRGRLRRHFLRRRQLRARAEPDARSHSRRRAVRERLRRERQHSRAGLSIAGLQRGPHRLVPVEGIDRLRHRHAQPEDRVSAHVDDRRSDVVHEQSESDLPRQQRRAESAHAIDFAVGERRACRLGRAVRAGAVDSRSSDAAGGTAIRSRTELVSGAAGRAVPIPADTDRHSRNTRRRQLQGHHAQDRRGLRRVRDRQDGDQDDHRQVSRRSRRVGPLRQHQSHACACLKPRPPSAPQV